jgi:GNAT superfamily N-acetyltransferase
MRLALRPATERDLSFAFEAKTQALGPYIRSKWGWDQEFQLGLHKQRWSKKSWFIVLLKDTPIGTVPVQDGPVFIRFGESYLLPEHQGKGLGSEILAGVLKRAEEAQLPVKLEYLNGIRSPRSISGMGSKSLRKLTFICWQCGSR